MFDAVLVVGGKRREKKGREKREEREKTSENEKNRPPSPYIEAGPVWFFPLN